jgi:DNA-binding NarL/FixJ family response regulator
MSTRTGTRPVHPVRILIADDHPLIRKGLRQVIEAEGTFGAIGEASDGVEALAWIEQHHPRVAIVDVSMPRMSGFDLAREAIKRKLDVAIIFLTMHNDRAMFDKAMDLGAKGYVLKDSAADEIVGALDSVMQGNAFVSARLSGYLVQRIERISLIGSQVAGLKDLTPAERRILKLIAGYKTSKEIAEILHIHYRTVENHRTNISAKLGLQGSHSLLKFAVEHQAELI